MVLFDNAYLFACEYTDNYWIFPRLALFLISVLLEDRLRLGNAQINLAFHSPCTIFARKCKKNPLDTYKTIVAPCEGVFTEKRSKFIAMAFPVTTLDEIKEHLAECQKRYFDARHVCYAYMLGHERTNFRANDNGEPSGTAGRPILGAINSRELTDILVVVVRYFGGIKLGTGGLIVAYKAAAAEALDVAEVVEKTVDLTLDVYFEYPMMNEVMRIVKEESPAVVEQDFQMDCRIRLSIRASRMPRLRERYEQLALETGRVRVE